MRSKNSHKNAGSAMLVVVCITSVFLVLSLSILLSASTLITAVNGQTARSQAQIFAISMSDTIKSELEKDFYIIGTDEQLVGNDENSINAFICENIWDYVYYVEPKNLETGVIPNTQFISPYSYWFYFKDDDTDSRHADEALTVLNFAKYNDSQYGEMNIRLSWTAADNASLSFGIMPTVANETTDPGSPKQQVGKVKLTVTVEVNYKDEAFTVSTEYDLTRVRTYVAGIANKEVWTWKLSERY